MENHSNEFTMGDNFYGASFDMAQTQAGAYSNTIPLNQMSYTYAPPQSDAQAAPTSSKGRTYTGEDMKAAGAIDGTLVKGVTNLDAYYEVLALFRSQAVKTQDHDKWMPRMARMMELQEELLGSGSTNPTGKDKAQWKHYVKANFILGPEGLIYRLTKGKDPKLVMPRESSYDYLCNAHVQDNGVHKGRDATFEQIKKYHGITKDFCAKFIAHCPHPTCIKRTAEGEARKENATKPKAKPKPKRKMEDREDYEDGAFDLPQREIKKLKGKKTRTRVPQQDFFDGTVFPNSAAQDNNNNNNNNNMLVHSMMFPPSPHHTYPPIPPQELAMGLQYQYPPVQEEVMPQAGYDLEADLLQEILAQQSMDEPVHNMMVCQEPQPLQELPTGLQYQYPPIQEEVVSEAGDDLEAELLQEILIQKSIDDYQYNSSCSGHSQFMDPSLVTNAKPQSEIIYTEMPFNASQIDPELAGGLAPAAALIAPSISSAETMTAWEQFQQADYCNTQEFGSHYRTEMNESGQYDWMDAYL